MGGVLMEKLDIELAYDKYMGWYLHQFIDIDKDNFITIAIEEDGVTVDVLNWNYDLKYDKCLVNLI